MGNDVVTGWLSHFPELIAALVVVGGWVLARLSRRALTSGLPWINKVSARWGSPGASVISPGFARVLQGFVYWGILLLAVILGLHLVGGGEPSDWTDGLLATITPLLVAIAILVAGHIVGLLVRSLLSGFSGKVDMGVLPQTAYGVVVAIAVLTALQHVGLDVSLITQVVLVIVTVFFAAIALAFALGARTLVANLAAQGEMQRYKPGAHITIDGVKGTILEIQRTGVVLSTAEGVACVPASKFAEMTVIETHPDEADG